MLIGILPYVRIFTIVVAVALYLFVWWYLYKHFDEFVRTGYGYPCFERFMGYFLFCVDNDSCVSCVWCLCLCVVSSSIKYKRRM